MRMQFAADEIGLLQAGPRWAGPPFCHRFAGRSFDLPPPATGIRLQPCCARMLAAEGRRFFAASGSKIVAFRQIGP